MLDGKNKGDSVRFFIAGGGCYGSYYLRQLDRARTLGKIEVTELVIVDRNPGCAVSKTMGSVANSRLEVCKWEDFGAQVWQHRALWESDMWVPTPIGPHILFHWIAKALAKDGTHRIEPAPYLGSLPPIPYAKTTTTGTLILSHAPGICPTNCVEPKICPLTWGPRDWEMKDTMEGLGVQALGTFVCQHYKHGVGTIALRDIYSGYDRIKEKVEQGARRVAVATVSSCHGILDSFDLVK